MLMLLFNNSYLDALFAWRKRNKGHILLKGCYIKDLRQIILQKADKMVFPITA